MKRAQIEAFGKITEGPYEAHGNGIHKRISPYYATCVGTTDGENRHVMAVAFASLPDLLQERKEMIAALKEAEEVLSKSDTLRHISPEFPALDKVRAVLKNSEGE